MENNEICTFGDFAVREIIERFTTELLKEYPFLSEEEARGFTKELGRQVNFLINNN